MRVYLQNPTLTRRAAFQSLRYAATLAVALLLCRACETLTASETPIDIGSETQLFLDDHVVAESGAVVKTVHPPTRHGPAVIEAEMPWEGPYLTYACPVIVGDKIYLYYKAYPEVWVGKGKKPADFTKMMRVVCVAVSEDGVHFKRPELPYFTGEGFERTNVVWAFYKSQVLNATAGVGIVNDPADADPQKRFKMAWSKGNTNTFAPATKIEGPSVAFSPDGLNWSDCDANPICNKFNSDTEQCVIYDPERKKWVWLLRMWEQPPSDGRIAWRQYGGRIRAVGRMESDDFVKWSEPEFVVCRDKDDPEFTDFYGLEAAWRHGMMIGFLWSAEWPEKYTDDVWPGTHGKMHAQLVVSRDSGKSWTRVDRRQMVFSPGPEGSWDSAQVYPGPMITRGDRHYVYYSGTAAPHGSGRRGGNIFKCDSHIGLATWKLDRFVSLDASPQGGTLTTKPIRFSGNRLVINAATAPSGLISIELLDADGRPLEGFAQSDPFNGDELRHLVAFGGNSDVSRLQGKTIKLRFHLKDAKLYSFTFRKSSTAAESYSASTELDRSRLKCKEVSGNEAPKARAITRGPKFHWFGYYDKLQFDPSCRYVLGMEVDFEHRSPRPDDVVKIGMVDLEDNDKWIELGETRAWCWQQGCMLQWRPGSKSEVLWNDRQGDRFVCRILDVKTGKKRTIPHPIYSVSPDGRWAVSPDFRRVNEMRPGYGYAGLPDPNRDVLAPADSGVFRVDLESGESRLIVSLADIVKIPHGDVDLKKAKSYFNHLLVSPDGSRFTFLHLWGFPKWTGATMMLTAAMDGSDIRIVDPGGLTSHFIWRDPNHILAWAYHKSNDNRFYLFEDKTGGKVEVVGKNEMTQNGHCIYLPGNRWILNDTYPDAQREQHPYLYRVATGERFPLGRFLSPKEYDGEWRCDLHPRFSPDGRKVVVDSTHEGRGRQLYLIDISGIAEGSPNLIKKLAK